MEHTHTLVRDRFTRAVAPALDPMAATTLFDLCNQIALLLYETSESVGTLLLTARNRTGVEPVLSLRTPLDVADVRGVRKLLQISTAELGVLCDGAEVYGLGRRLGPTDLTLAVAFERYGRWRLTQGQQHWLDVDVATLPGTDRGLSSAVLTEHLEQVFGPVSPTVATRLWQLVEAASDQDRGTTILISPDAAAEVIRLRTQCTVLAPVELTPQLMKSVTSIDGTVIIDLGGVCHAVGAILDGPVSRRGDRTRGGRFNSALMYVDNFAGPCLIVTVSQDGPVDYVHASPGLTKA